MGRNNSRGRGFSKKHDTPVKPALSKLGRHRRLLVNRHHEAFPEEEEEEMAVPTVKPASPVWPASLPVLHLNVPAYTEYLRYKAASPATPADKISGCQVSPTRHPTTIQVIPDTAALKAGKVLVKEEEQHLAVTPESIISSSIETDSSPSFGDDDHSASSSFSSLPSPEVFRKDNDVETLTFPTMNSLLDLHLHIKNSTLLDVSHAEPIHVHHNPNLSSIICASTSRVEKNCQISNHRRPEAETKLQMDSDNKKGTFEWKPPGDIKPTGCLLQLTNKRPIVCKKKVSFKTPIIVNTFPATKLTIHSASESDQTSGPAEPTQPDAETSKEGEMNSEDDTLLLRVKLRRPVESSPEKATFFDFVSDGERDLFFQRMRERSVRLRNAPLFPLSAAEETEASGL